MAEKERSVTRRMTGWLQQSKITPEFGMLTKIRRKLFALCDVIKGLEHHMLFKKGEKYFQARLSEIGEISLTFTKFLDSPDLFCG